MSSFIAALTLEHRGIEVELDRLGTAIALKQIDGEYFRQVKSLIMRHYIREGEFIARLHEHEPGLASKLTAQHDEALEIAAKLEESLTAGQSSDVAYLARRFLAIAQHNIIEEERDAFPLAERCFGAE